MKTITTNNRPQSRGSFRTVVRGIAMCTAALFAVTAAASLSPARSEKAMAPGANRKMMKMSGIPAYMQPCAGCHAPNFGGRKGFSPSLRSSGILKKYNLKTFERVMNTGVTNGGGKVRRPMPVFHYPASTSAKEYAYLKKLK